MPINRLLVTMALPIMISMIIQAMYNIVDSLFVARISEQALTAVSLAYSVQNLLIGVAVGTGVGVNSCCPGIWGTKPGRRQQDSCKRDFHYAGYLSVLPGVWVVFHQDVFQITDRFRRNHRAGRAVPVHLPDFSVGVLEQVVLERILQGTGKTIYTMITQGRELLLI